MSVLNEIIELCKQAKQKPSTECDSLYDEVNKRFESLREQGTVKEDDLLINWAISVANHASQTVKEEDKKRLLEEAQSKYSEALQKSTEKKHVVLYNWGNLLLDQGEAEVQSGNNGKADEWYTEARSKYDKALEYKDDYIDALHNLSRALNRQGQLKEGNQKFWFVSQAAEKERRVEEIKSGTATSSTGKTLTPEEKLAAGIKEKEKGNDFFKKGDLAKALFYWHTTLNYVNGLYGLSKAQEASVVELKVTVHNNMGTVHIKQGKHDRAIVELNKVLELDPKNVKGLFRRGKAYLALNDTDKAKVDLEKARDLAPDDKDIKAELTALVKKEKEQDKNLKSMYSKMF